MMILKHNRKGKNKNNNPLFGNPRLMRLKKPKSNINRPKTSENRCILKRKEIHGAILKLAKILKNNQVQRNDFYS